MNEYTGLSERQLKIEMEEAQEANDWEAMSKISVANQSSGFAGLPVKFQATFIDKR